MSDVFEAKAKITRYSRRGDLVQTASPKLRVALEKAAAGDLDAALEEAIAAEMGAP